MEKGIAKAMKIGRIGFYRSSGKGDEKSKEACQNKVCAAASGMVGKSRDLADSGR